MAWLLAALVVVGGPAIVWALERYWPSDDYETDKRPFDRD